MKKIIAIIFIIVLCMSCLSVLATSPLDPAAILSVSERDAAGNITLTLKVRGVDYQGVQASVYYNPEELLLTEEHLKTITVGEPIGNKNSLNLVQAALHAESNCIAVTVIMDLSLMDDEIYYLSSMEKQMTVFSLTVPAVTDKPDVGFALKESHVYDKGNPYGLVISYNGESQEAATKVLYADGTIGQTGELKNPAPVKTPAELRAERIKNTVIIQLNNYAAVKEGALCYVDENNKAVMPFQQAGEWYIPYRFVAEAFGYTVGWSEERQAPYQDFGRAGAAYLAKDNFVLRECRSFIRISDVPRLMNLSAVVVGDCMVFTDVDIPWNAAGVIEQGILSDALMIMSPAIRDMK